MDKHANPVFKRRTFRRTFILAAMAFLAPFYFVFPGPTYEQATPDERRLIWICIAAGCLGYALAIILLVG